MLGPLLNADQGTSGELIRKLMMREMPACPEIGFAPVDVRDVALAHRLAMERPEAAGNRYICAGEHLWVQDMAKVLAAEFNPKGFRIPTGRLPYWLMWIIARFDKAVASRPRLRRPERAGEPRQGRARARLDHASDPRHHPRYRPHHDRAGRRRGALTCGDRGGVERTRDISAAPALMRRPLRTRPCRDATWVVGLGPPRYPSFMTRKLTIVVTVLSLWLVSAVAPVAAQVCGDADGSGTVTVTDGVVTLRAAAGLETACTPATCDVDGNGAVTVTDGVNVLRQAAELPAFNACPGGSTGQPQSVLRELQTLLTIGLPYATGTKVTGCANDGTVEDLPPDQDGVDTEFFSCQVGSVLIEGDIIVAPALLTFSFLAVTTADENEDDIANYDGSLTLGTSGAGRSLNGTIDFDSESAGPLLPLTFADTVIVGAQLTSGTATLDLTDSDIVDAFTSLVLTFDGSGVAQVQATQSNGGTANYRFTIATGDVQQQ